MIWSFALVLCFKLFWSNAKISYGRKGMTPERVKSRKQKVAAWVREGLIKLGPTFIKIGQQVSCSCQFARRAGPIDQGAPPLRPGQQRSH